MRCSLHEGSDVLYFLGNIVDYYRRINKKYDILLASYRYKLGKKNKTKECYTVWPTLDDSSFFISEWIYNISFANDIYITK